MKTIGKELSSNIHITLQALDINQHTLSQIKKQNIQRISQEKTVTTIPLSIKTISECKSSPATNRSALGHKKIKSKKPRRSATLLKWLRGTISAMCASKIWRMLRKISSLAIASIKYAMRAITTRWKQKNANVQTAVSITKWTESKSTSRARSLLRHFHK